MTTVLVDPSRLGKLVRRYFERAGSPAREAALIADHLMDADLTGHESHGVVRMKRYMEWVAAGTMRLGQRPETVLDTGALAILEGRFGPGLAIGHRLVELGVEKARAHGLATVCLRHVGHLGRLGYWAEKACEEDVVTLSFLNVAGSMLVAPFGSRERRMCTAPIAVGVPCASGRHFILDISTSKVAEGKVLAAVNGGKPLPPASFIGPDGLTDDPSVLYGKIAPSEVPDPRKGPGALMPMGDHKGSGLALACELLGGLLTGSGTSGPQLGPVYNGVFAVFLDMNRLGDAPGLKREADAYLDFIRSAAPIDPENPVLVPGDVERTTRAERLRDGIPLPAQTFTESLLPAGEALGIRRRDVARALNVSL